MAQVDFYVVRGGGGGECERVACRVVEKAWQLGHRVYLHAADTAQAQRLDELLWSFRQESFVPHGPAGEADAAQTPVVVGCGEDATGRDVLVNLAEEIPACAAVFERIAEVVADGAAARAAGRQRYGEYRKRGYDLRHHDV